MKGTVPYRVQNGSDQNGLHTESKRVPKVKIVSGEIIGLNCSKGLERSIKNNSTKRYVCP
jgi:hypothetical protein